MSHKASAEGENSELEAPRNEGGASNFAESDTAEGKTETRCVACQWRELQMCERSQQVARKLS